MTDHAVCSANHSNRNDIADIMKGIGILAIMLGHFTTAINGLLFSFHVPLFFLLAGYFFKGNTCADSIKKDAKRLLLPYGLTCLVIILFYALRQLYHDESLSSQWLLASIWGSGSRFHTSQYFADVPPIGAIWFLLSLFWCKQAFSVIKRSAPVFYPVICLAVSIGGTLLDRLYINLPFALLPGLSALVFFCVGEMIHPGNTIKISNSVRNYSIFLCCAAWLVVLYLSQLHDIRLSVARCFYRCYPLDVIAAFGGIWIVFRLSVLINKLPAIFNRLMVWIGRNSLVFLCLHLIDLNIGIRHYFHIGGGVPGFSFSLALCMLGTIALSFIPPLKQMLKVHPF